MPSGSHEPRAFPCGAVAHLHPPIGHAGAGAGAAGTLLAVGVGPLPLASIRFGLPLIGSSCCGASTRFQSGVLVAARPGAPGLLLLAHHCLDALEHHCATSSCCCCCCCCSYSYFEAARLALSRALAAANDVSPGLAFPCGAIAFTMSHMSKG